MDEKLIFKSVGEGIMYAFYRLAEWLASRIFSVTVNHIATVALLWPRTHLPVVTNMFCFSRGT